MVKLFKSKNKFMKKLALVLAFFLFPEIALACFSPDYEFRLTIGSLKLNIQKIESLCSEKTCVIEQDFIFTKSHFDERVSVIFERVKKELIFLLPYSLSEEGKPLPSFIEPKNYDWKSLVRTELSFLKEVGALEISEEEIEKISGIAENGKNIYFCKEWKLLKSNCICEDGEEVCFRCGSGKMIETKLPQEVLKLESKEVSQDFIYYLSLIILIGVFVAIFLRTRFVPQPPSLPTQT